MDADGSFARSKEEKPHAKTCPLRFAQPGARSKTTAFRVAMQAGAKAQRRAHKSFLCPVRIDAEGVTGLHPESVSDVGGGFGPKGHGNLAQALAWVALQ